MKTYQGTRPSSPRGLNDPRSTGAPTTKPRPIDPGYLRSKTS